LVELNSLDVTHAQWVAKVKALKVLTHHLKKRRKSFWGRKIFDMKARKSLQFLFAEKEETLKKTARRDSTRGRIAKLGTIAL